MALISQIKNLIKKIGKVSDGQAKIVEIDEDMTIIKVEFKPNGGPYKGGKWLFKITIDPYNWHYIPPNVFCLTSIYHPNIDTTDMTEDDGDNICLNMLDNWQSGYGLDGLINGILFLFYHPEIEDPLSPYISPGMEEEEFLNNVKASLLGGEVDGFYFDRNWDEDEETSDVIEKTSPPESNVDLSNNNIEKQDDNIAGAEKNIDQVDRCDNRYREKTLSEQINDLVDTKYKVKCDSDSDYINNYRVFISDLDNLVDNYIDKSLDKLSDSLTVSHNSAEKCSDTEQSSSSSSSSSSSLSVESVDLTEEVNPSTSIHNNCYIDNDKDTRMLVPDKLKTGLPSDKKLTKIKSFDGLMPKETDFLHVCILGFFKKFLCCTSDNTLS